MKSLQSFIRYVWYLQLIAHSQAMNIAFHFSKRDLLHFAQFKTLIPSHFNIFNNSLRDIDLFYEKTFF